MLHVKWIDNIQEGELFRDVKRWKENPFYCTHHISYHDWILGCAVDIRKVSSVVNKLIDNLKIYTKLFSKAYQLHFEL